MAADTDLRGAAAAIRQAVAEFEAERLTNPYWSGVTFREGVDGGLGGAGGKLAALMGDPGVALAVADWLDKDDLYCWGPAEKAHALAVAREVLRRDSTEAVSR